ncbi:unnamed protein product [Amoebophrya sp. A25]|nr:unnamed protein product [Amoebophrya sp. A25]|eukprot:GSA25T00004167001.1
MVRTAFPSGGCANDLRDETGTERQCTSGDGDTVETSARHSWMTQETALSLPWEESAVSRVRLFFPSPQGENGSGRFVDLPASDRPLLTIALQHKMLQNFKRRLEFTTRLIPASFSQAGVRMDWREGSSRSQLEHLLTRVVRIGGASVEKEESCLGNDGKKQHTQMPHSTGEETKTGGSKKSEPEVVGVKTSTNQRACFEKLRKWIRLHFTRGRCRGYCWQDTWYRTPAEQRPWHDLERDLLDSVYSVADGGLLPSSDLEREVDFGAILEDIARFIELRSRKASLHPADRFSDKENALLTVELEGSALPLLKMLIMEAADGRSQLTKCRKGDMYSVIQEIPWDFGSPACVQGNNGRSVFADLATFHKLSVMSYIGDSFLPREWKGHWARGYRGRAFSFSPLLEEMRQHPAITDPRSTIVERETKETFSSVSSDATPETRSCVLFLHEDFAKVKAYITGQHLATQVTDKSGLAPLELAVVYRNAGVISLLLGKQHDTPVVAPPLLTPRDLAKKIFEDLFDANTDRESSGAQCSSESGLAAIGLSAVENAATDVSKVMDHDVFQYLQKITAYQLACHLGCGHVLRPFLIACYDTSKSESYRGRACMKELRNSNGLALSGFSKHLLLGQRDPFGRSPLHLVCCAAMGRYSGPGDAAAHILLNEMSPAEVNAVDHLGRSALMYAGRNAHFASFCKILECCCHSVDVNRREPATGNTAFLLLMHEAETRIWSERVDAIDRRLRRVGDGSYPRRPDKDFKPRSYDYFLTVYDKYNDSTRREAYLRPLTEVWALLQQHGCDVTARNNQGEDCFALALKYRGRTFAKCLREVVRGDTPAKMVLLPKKIDRVSRRKRLGGFFPPRGPSMLRLLNRLRNRGGSRMISKNDGSATSLAPQSPVALKSSSRTSVLVLFAAVLVLVVAFAVVSPNPFRWFSRE